MGGELKRLFATNLRSAMDREPALTQEKLAGEVGVSFHTVSAWCQGKSVPGGLQLVALSLRFAKPAEWFFADHDLEKESAA